MSKRTGRTGKYPFIARLTGSWKKRAKKSKILLKDLAKNADIAPQHLTKTKTVQALYFASKIVLGS